MELIKITDSTYYIENPTNIGIYRIDEKNVFLIDSGNDKEAGKKIIKIMEEQGWTIKGVIATHSNADHIGGNKIIQDRTGAKIYAHGIEKSFTEHPDLEGAFLYGGFPFKELKNKFLCAKESVVEELSGNIPSELEYFSLKGHFFDQIGIKTPDDVYFLGDSLFSEETIQKYKVFFVYDVKEFINTLDFLSTLKGKLFIPSHAKATTDLTGLIAINRQATEDVINTLLSLLRKSRTFEDLLQCIFDEYNLAMNPNQYVLIGSTIKSYLSYLYDEALVTYEFIENKMYWRASDAEVTSGFLLTVKEGLKNRNRHNCDLVIKALNDCSGIEVAAKIGRGKYQYDYIWIDVTYKEKPYRICFYEQDIDLNSLNVHIFQGKYTFQRSLVKNFKTPLSVFGFLPTEAKGIRELKDLKDAKCTTNDELENYVKRFLQLNFHTAQKNIQTSKYDIDNFDLNGFIEEFKDFIGYSEQ